MSPEVSEGSLSDRERQGSLHSKLMLDYGTNIVGGVTPGKGGTEVHGLPVFDSVEEATGSVGKVDASVIMVPSPYAYDAMMEAMRSGLGLLVVVTEGIPVHDTVRVVGYAKRSGTVIIGPNTPGIIAPGEGVKIGIMPAEAFPSGRTGIVSRSGTLTYEISVALREAGMGTSTALGIGGDPITGLNFVEVLEMMREDEGTDAVVLVGEIGGNAEEESARYLARTDYPKSVVAFIAGRTAPPGKRMGHAGAIISGTEGRMETKERALIEAGVSVAKRPWEVPSLLLRALGR